MRISRSLVLLAAGALLAQAPTAFEVAVIHPSQAEPGAGSSLDLFDGGRIKITNEPAKLLLRIAFELQNSQIAGGPAWLDNDRYDIEAKTGRREKIPQGQMAPLMRSLLADRFGLKSHRETRELPVYALVAVTPKLKPKKEGEVAGMSTSGGTQRTKATATATSMDLLASYIGNRLGRIVVDRTGLTGSYDFTLEWAPDQAADSTLPSLTTALKEQLGLTLQAQKSPVEVLVIDSIQRPSEN
jgi:uncharacterized protein (TIGR03435 family)